MLALAWHGVDCDYSNLQNELVPCCELLANVHNTTGSQCYAMIGTLLMAGTALLLILTGID